MSELYVSSVGIKPVMIPIIISGVFHQIHLSFGRN